MVNKTPKEIEIEYLILKQFQDNITEAIKALQSECTHKNLRVSPCSDTGNYDPSYDSYWTDYKCLDCHKGWRDYQ